MYAHKGGTKKLKRHGLHGFALDQPSINGSGPINRSEKMKRSETVGNGRKRSETWSGKNLFNSHFFLNKHFRATPFFFWRSKGVQGETVGNSRRSHLRSAKKTCFYTICKHIFTLHQILHLDLDIQYSLKNTKSQELVKFNTTDAHVDTQWHTCVYMQRKHCNYV